MKKITLLLALLFVLGIFNGFSQGINYKALIKDGNGAPITNQMIDVQFTILQGAAETNVYQESHSTLTDDNGIIIVNLGEGNILSGDFGMIDWASDYYALKTEVDIGAGYVDMGTSLFKTVPYALVAENVPTRISDLNDGRSDVSGISLFIGENAGLNDDGSDNENTGMGYEALKDNTSGFWNTAFGFISLSKNTTGFRNTAFGHKALANNTEGWNNTAHGHMALEVNTTGNCNTAYGSVCLKNNTTGVYNTAVGNRAMFANTTGSDNSAYGYSALGLNTSGYENTATGTSALFKNTVGYWNTSSGFESMYNNIGGDNNVANGYHALYNNISGNYNTASGFEALSDNTTGTNNTALGYNAQVPDGTQNNQVRIGNTNVTYAGVQVAWTITSDRKWKEGIRDLPYGLELIKQLRPVDYVRKNNETKTREAGFIAQDVEELLVSLGYSNQGIVATDSKGMKSVRYNDFIAVLTKALQEQQEIIEKQQGTIEALNVEIENGKQERDKFDKRLKEIEILLKSN